MRLPAFFAEVPTIRLRDPLAEFLGTAGEGVLEYGYADAVKLAGHSCPTVAGAYGLTRRALLALYGEGLPERGGVRADVSASIGDGVTGVIASVVTLLTGAAGEGGFKGLGGRHVRRGLLHFAAGVPLEIRYTRLDSGSAVDAAARLSAVPGDPRTGEMLSRCLSGAADAEERRTFGELWQARVRRLLIDHGDDPEVFIVRPA